MNNPEFLKLKQQYVIKKVNDIMKSHPKIKYDIQFRSGKIKTAGTVLEDPKTHFKNFIFSNYWIQAFLKYELDGLIKHECAHAISDNTHGNKFIMTCNKMVNCKN
jgi:hypothetical protein